MASLAGTDFEYDNESARSRGRLLTAAGRVLPGIATVHEQSAPFAADWRRANAVALASSDGPLWVALGDSLTQGIGAPSYDRGWVGQVAARLAMDGRAHRVVNLAVTGARTADLIERQLPALATLCETLPTPPALVTVMIGSNDLLRREYRRALPSGIAEVVRRVPAGTLVATLPNPSGVASIVNDVIYDVARERGLRVAELRDPRTTSWRGKLAADHFHPNEAGYSSIAAVMWDAVRPG